MPDAISLLDSLPPAPTDTAAPAAPAAPEAPPAEEGIPDEVLALPEFNALLTGQTPAVAINKDDPAPEAAIVAKNQDPLVQAGFGFYPAKDGVTRVLFNTQFISLEELQKADKEGNLANVVTPFAELKGSFASAMGGGAPQPAAGEAVAPEAAGSAPVAAPAVSAPPQAVATPPAESLDKKLATARLQSITPGGPTSGPKPGAGRIQNAIMRPVV